MPFLENVALHTTIMIRTFQHKGLKLFFDTGSVAGIQPSHAHKLAAILSRLNEASSEQSMNLPGWHLHALKGKELKGHFSVRVSENWRVTFRFERTDAILVDYRDYH